MARTIGLLMVCLMLVASPAVSRAMDIERPDVREFIEDVVKRDHLDRTWVEKMVLTVEADFRQMQPFMIMLSKH